MLYYKIDVLKCLKAAGYNTTRLRKEKLLGENALTMLRKQEIVGAKVLDRLCTLLQKQPGDILGHLLDEGVTTTEEAPEKHSDVRREGDDDEGASLH